MDADIQVDAATITRRVHLAYSVGVLSIEKALPDTKLEAASGEGDLLALVFTSPDGAERDVFVVADAQRSALLRGLTFAGIAASIPDDLGLSSIPTE